ncbi:hypothetical protein P4H42_08170 [Paenibacillus macerans]|uniref:hypothetical protein n=1 Tax=Paenibacillus macerans TaxID=44252 RepID=UPI002DBFC5F2|nr:hypothetical protein [Paenibacillus macerans]MEC0329597.1 hypothetical protein [Paenibacillus macerans]
MINKLLEEIFDNSNQHIFKLDALPWKDEKIILKNISTFTKRRISVKGVRNLLKKDNLVDSSSYSECLENYLITEVTNSETYVVITELGLLYLNTMISGQTQDHYTAIKISKDLFTKYSAEVLKRKFENVFSIDISTQEAILSLFLLLNGANSYSSAFQLHTNQKGEYLHGKSIINEINSLYIELTGDDQENLIKDEKEFRNVIGRNGKNGRLAKAFPSLYQREEGKIWFQLNDRQINESSLIILKNMIMEILRVLSKEFIYETICNNLIHVVEKYMINNPIEPYILRDIFSGLNKFNHLIDLHVVAKDLISDTVKYKE